MCGKIEKLSDWNKNSCGTKKKKKKILCARGRGGSDRGGGFRWGPPIKKWGSDFFFRVGRNRCGPSFDSDILPTIICIPLPKL